MWETLKCFLGKYPIFIVVILMAIAILVWSAGWGIIWIINWISLEKRKIKEKRNG